MSSIPTNDSSTETTYAASNDDGMTNDDLNKPLGHEGEGDQARRLKAQAMAHDRAARIARAKYERMTSMAEPRGSNPGDSTHAEALAVRIGRTEVALAASAVARQLEQSLPAQYASNDAIQALFRWAPTVALKPDTHGSGFGAFVSDPRVWSAATIAVLAFVKHLQTPAGAASGDRARDRADGQRPAPAVSSEQYEDVTLQEQPEDAESSV